jgi:5-formyltetrahydrofolate cyclo-ligase
MPTKSELRRQFRKQRRALPARLQSAHSEAIARHFSRSLLPLGHRRIGVFISADGEPDTLPLIDALWSMGKQVCLPVVRSFSKRLEFYGFDPQTELVPGAFGIPVPAADSPHTPLLALDLLLMPLVAFDRHGTRLGMGGGFYDRTLCTLPSRLRPRLIGLAHSLQYSAAELPHAWNDVSLDAVITERGVRLFTPPVD